MPTLAELWLPIVVSAAAVWIASALAWMVMPHHRGESKGMPDEDGAMAYIRSQNLSPGTYGFPDCQDHKKMKDPEFAKKVKAGPMGFIHVWPANAMETMGSKMMATFVYCLVVGTLLAYLGTMALPKGVDFLHVFRFIGTAGIMSYTLSRIPNDIWFSVPRRTMINCFVDGVVFGLICGAVFGWMWPSGT